MSPALFGPMKRFARCFSDLLTGFVFQTIELFTFFCYTYWYYENRELKNMNRKYRILVMIAVALILTSCKKETAFVPDYEKPVGMIVIPDAANLEQGTVAANRDGYKYTFENMDAAAVYYFNMNAEESVAGSQKTYSLTLGSDETQGAAGATAKVAYKGTAGNGTTITAYSLYYDGSELFFDSTKPTLSEELTDGLVMQGKEYPCEMEFTVIKPVGSFSLKFLGDDAQQIHEVSYTPAEVEDYQQVEIPEGTISIRFTSYDMNNEIIETKELTSKDYSLNVCFDDGGELLDCKTLRLLWKD